MKYKSDEEVLVKIQHDWADARRKRDSAFPKQIEADDFTVVWFDGKIVSKEEDVETYESNDAVFTEMSGEWKAVASQVTPVLGK